MPLSPEALMARKREPDPTLEELAAHYGVSTGEMRKIMIYAREVGRVLAEHIQLTDEDRAEIGRLLAERQSGNDSGPASR